MSSVTVDDVAWCDMLSQRHTKSQPFSLYFIYLCMVAYTITMFQGYISTHILNQSILFFFFVIHNYSVNVAVYVPYVDI